MAHDERRLPEKDFFPGEIQFHENTAPPAGELPYHYHDPYEIFVSLNDTLPYRVNGHVYELRRGDLLTLTQFDIHQSLAPAGEPYHRLIVLFYPELLRGWSTGAYELLARFGKRAQGASHMIRLNTRDLSQFRAAFDRGRMALDDTRSQRPVAERMMEARLALAELLLVLNRGEQLEGSGEAGHSALSIEEDARLAAILDHIDRELHSELSLARLSGLFGTTPSGLNRLFRKANHLSVHQYILQRRIQEARLSLSRGRSVTEAAAASGFASLPHFVRIFRAKTGASPKEFQRRILERMS